MLLNVGLKRTTRTAVLRWLSVVALAAGIFGTAAVTQAAVVGLDDLNSHVDIDTESSDGMETWAVDGTDHMFQQWFWYRVGNNAEQSLDTLVHDPVADEIATNSNFNPGIDRLTTRYTDAGGAFQIVADYVLTGGNSGSGRSDVWEVISITNTSNAPLDFHFFQYSDGDLTDTSDDSAVEFANLNLASQFDPTTKYDTTFLPGPDRTEVGLFDATLQKLTNGVADNLDNTKGPLTGGDLTWAGQWDRVIPVRGTFLIGIHKQVAPVPEPSSLVLAGLGVLGLALIRRRAAR